MALKENPARTGNRVVLFCRKVGLSAPLSAVLLVGFIFVPVFPGMFWTEVATEILILGLFAMSFNLIYGYMGQISFGHAAFFGLGAYATAILFREFSGGTGERGSDCPPPFRRCCSWVSFWCPFFPECSGPRWRRRS